MHLVGCFAFYFCFAFLFLPHSSVLYAFLSVLPFALLVLRIQVIRIGIANIMICRYDWKIIMIRGVFPPKPWLDNERQQWV